MGFLGRDLRWVGLLLVLIHGHVGLYVGLVRSGHGHVGLLTDHFTTRVSNLDTSYFEKADVTKLLEWLSSKPEGALMK